MAADNRADEKQGWSSSIPEIALLLGLALAYFLNVTLFEIDPYSELFHIEAAKESAFAHHFWVPFLQGQEYLARAPLWTWLITLLFNLFGPDLMIARIPAILFAFVGIALTYMLGTTLFQNRVAALFSALTLATGWGFFHGAVLSTADSAACCLMLAFTWLILQWHPPAIARYISKGEMGLYSLLFGVVFGVMLLLKGSLTVGAMLLAWLVFLLVTNTPVALRTISLPRLLGPMLGIPLLWLVPVAIARNNSGVILDYLIAWPFAQFMGQGAWQGLQSDWLFYIKRLALDLIPYGLFLLAFAFDPAVRRRLDTNTRNAIQWLTALSVSAFAFWSFSHFQEPTGLLPYYPGIALLIGFYLGRVMEMGETSKAYNAAAGVYIVSLMLLAVALTVFIFQVLPDRYVDGFWHLPGIPLIESIGKSFPLEHPIPLWKMWLVPAPFILIAGGTVLYFMFENRRLHLAGFALIATSLVFLLFVKAVYMPVLSRPVAQIMAGHINQEPLMPGRIVIYSHHADLKRALFFLDGKLTERVRFVNSTEDLAKELAANGPGTYGLIREESFYDLDNYQDGQLRQTLRVEEANWKLDSSRLPELAKILRIRLPVFARMESHLILFQSVSPISLESQTGSTETDVSP